MRTREETRVKVDLEGRVVLVNREVEALTKGDLREIIDD